LLNLVELKRLLRLMVGHRLKSVEPRGAQTAGVALATAELVLVRVTRVVGTTLELVLTALEVAAAEEVETAADDEAELVLTGLEVAAAELEVETTLDEVVVATTTELVELATTAVVEVEVAATV